MHTNGFFKRWDDATGKLLTIRTNQLLLSVLERKRSKKTRALCIAKTG